MEAATGKELHTFVGHSSAVWSVAISPDDSLVATASDDGTARVWDASTGKEIREFAVRHHPDSNAFFSPDSVQSIDFSPDGTRILTGNEDAIARLWDVKTGDLLQAFRGHGSAVECVAFAPDGRRILTGSADATARLWKRTRDLRFVFTETRA